MELSLLCFIVAAILFVIDAIGVKITRINATAAGLFFLALGFIL